MTASEPITPLNELKIYPEPNSGCWLWVGNIARGGYGQSWCRRERRYRAAHRVVYESHFGHVPNDIELDHLCRTRCCVNPAHLEPVTGSVNVKRGLLPKVTSERCRAVTHCPHGHEYTPENTYFAHIKEFGWTTRKCRACERIRKAERYKKSSKSNDCGDRI